MVSQEKPDILCLQETKAHPTQLEDAYLAPFGYQSFWHSAKKSGYSGVAIYCRVGAATPTDVQEGIGKGKFDDEGRVLTAHFKAFSVVSAYFPNSQRDHARLGYKLEFCDHILKYCDGLKKGGRGVVLCGDYNIAHREIDLKNPKSNQDNAGFLPEERAWMDRFLGAGYVDTFRHFCDAPGHYTWWSYRPGVRERNIGWRLDYHCVNREFMGKVKEAFITPETGGSDHCPVGIILKS